MKKILISLISISIVVSLYLYSGLSTKVLITQYYFEGVNNGIEQSSYFDLSANSTLEYIKAEDSGLGYDQEIYKNPYSYSLIIDGDFDRVENVKLFIKLDNGETIEPEISDLEINRNIEDSDYNGMKMFESDKKTIDFDVKEVNKVSVLITFTGIIEGRSKEIELSGEYEIIKQERESTRLVEIMPSA